MADIVVVYHSGYGHTQRMAQAVADGAGARMLAIDSDGQLPAGGWELLAAADAIIFGSPTYMGGPSWQFKRFADASSKPWFVQAWKDKLFAGFTNSASVNGNKQTTLDYLFQLAMQHGGLWVGSGMLPSNARRAAQRPQLDRRLQRRHGAIGLGCLGRRDAAGRPGDRAPVRRARGAAGAAVDAPGRRGLIGRLH